MGYRLPFGDPMVVDSTREFAITGLHGDPLVVSSQRVTAPWSIIVDGDFKPLTIEMPSG